MTDFFLREVTNEDVRLLWEWRNDSLVRETAFDQEFISWKSHACWFDRKLSSVDCRIWILQDDGFPVGQVRYDRGGEIAELTYSVSKEFRGRGLGTVLLQMSTPLAGKELDVAILVAFVKQGNLPSMRALKRSGFERMKVINRNNEQCWKFQKSCESCNQIFTS